MVLYIWYISRVFTWHVYLVLQLEAVLGLGDEAGDHLEADNSWRMLIEYLQETHWIHNNTFYAKFTFLIDSSFSFTTVI
jgi:hypothetical protein